MNTVPHSPPIRLTTQTNTNDIQCRTKVGAIDAAALGPLKKQAHGRGREKGLLYISVVIPLVGTISGKSLKLAICHILKLKCTKFDFGWCSAQTPLRELTVPTQPP